MLLYRTERHIIAEDSSGREVFNLQSKRDCERLQAITKAGFDLIIDMPGEVLDVSTLEFLN